MQKTIVTGNVALIDGPAYDFPRVCRAHLRVIDALVERFGAGFICGDLGPDRFPWPGSGRISGKLAWEGLKKRYDASPNRVLFLTQDVSLVIRLLGRQLCLQDAETGALSLRDDAGTDYALSQLDPTPTISIHGPWNPAAKKFRMLPQQTVDAIGVMVGQELRLLQLDFGCTTTVTEATMRAEETDICALHFPYDVYGEGRSTLAVRCRSSDGGEPEPTHVDSKGAGN